MAGWNVKVAVLVAVVVIAVMTMAVVVRQGGSPREGQGPGEKPCCDGKFYVFHIDSFCLGL
jgi:hypothetical protein